MSIAQRSVAREGELHPAQPAPLAVPNDSAALAAFHCDSVNLPWVIFRAAFRANQMQQLPRRARAVLAALARTVDAARPFASIFARRELLMGRAMQSLRTLYRSLDDLEGAGLIERAPQSRYAEIGRFGRSNLQLTERAAALLGFVDQPVTQLSAKTAAAADPLPEAPVQAPDIEALSFTSPSAKLALGAIYKDLSPTPFQKRQPGQLPSDLQRLRSLGFIDFLIFKLMREARENGKRLSDVVEATWDHLKAAKAPINYLRTLLRSPVDFGHQLRHRRSVRAEERIRVDRASHAELIAQQSAGQTFIDSTGERKYVVDADARSMTVYAVDEGVGRQAAAWKEVFAEARKHGRIRIASFDDLEAFAQARRTHAQRTFQLQTRGRQADEKSEVTPQVRDHIAGLRNILRSYGHSRFVAA
jgi:hypothetical protein